MHFVTAYCSSSEAVGLCLAVQLVSTVAFHGLPVIIKIFISTGTLNFPFCSSLFLSCLNFFSSSCFFHSWWFCLLIRGLLIKLFVKFRMLPGLRLSIFFLRAPWTANFPMTCLPSRPDHFFPFRLAFIFLSFSIDNVYLSSILLWSGCLQPGELCLQQYF